MPIAALLASLLACTGRQTPAPDDALTDPIELLDAMRARLDPLWAARVRAVMESYIGGERLRVRQVILVRAPSDLRIETLSPMDTTLAVLVSNATTLSFWDLESDRFLSGPPGAEQVARLVPLHLSPADIVRVVLGGPPLDGVAPDPTAWTLQWDRRRGAYRLSLPLDVGGTRDVFVEHGTWVLSGAREFDGEGHLLWELRTGSLEPADADGVRAVLPRRLAFSMEREEADISLEIERIDLNPALPDSLFELVVPTGIPVESL